MLVRCNTSTSPCTAVPRGAGQAPWWWLSRTAQRHKRPVLVLPQPPAQAGCWAERHQAQQGAAAGGQHCCAGAGAEVKVKQGAADNPSNAVLPAVKGHTGVTEADTAFSLWRLVLGAGVFFSVAFQLTAGGGSQNIPMARERTQCCHAMLMCY